MTAPSDDWRDTEPDEFEPANPLLDEQGAEGGEDYNPATPRPDRDGRADEADVVDQAYEVEVGDEDEDDD